MSMRVFAVLAAVLLWSGTSFAQCACRCVDGEMQAICTNAWEAQPVCPPTVCPIAPPAVAPTLTPAVPPPGMSQCQPRQVLNPKTGAYDWQTVCR